MNKTQYSTAYIAYTITCTTTTTSTLKLFPSTFHPSIHPCPHTSPRSSQSPSNHPLTPHKPQINQPHPIPSSPHYTHNPQYRIKTLSSGQMVSYFPHPPRPPKEARCEEGATKPGGTNSFSCAPSDPSPPNLAPAPADASNALPRELWAWPRGV